MTSGALTALRYGADGASQRFPSASPGSVAVCAPDAGTASTVACRVGTRYGLSERLPHLNQRRPRMHLGANEVHAPGGAEQEEHVHQIVSLPHRGRDERGRQSFLTQGTTDRTAAGELGRNDCGNRAVRGEMTRPKVSLIGAAGRT